MRRARRADRAAWAAGTLAVITTATTFLGWGRSGERTRTSYELVEVAGRAGVVDPDLAWLAPLWFGVPAACGVVVLALAMRRRVIAGGLTTTLGALVGMGAILVDRSPLVAAPAARVAVALGGATVLGGAAVLVTARKEMAG